MNESNPCVSPISAELDSAGSQLVSDNERSALACSPLSLPQWKQRLVSYFGDTRH